MPKGLIIKFAHCTLECTLEVDIVDVRTFYNCVVLFKVKVEFAGLRHARF